MSDRERWIVYPLLFLCLGLTLKPKFTHQMEVGDLHCRTLTCGNEANGNIVQMHSGMVHCRELQCGDDESGNFLRLETDRVGPVVNYFYKGQLNEQFPIYANDAGRRPIHIGNVFVRSQVRPLPQRPAISPTTPATKKPRPPEPIGD